ncbi:MAG: hypothetical protein R2838_04995 [Caldilineaceae bacterium]
MNELSGGPDDRRLMHAAHDGIGVPPQRVNDRQADVGTAAQRRVDGGPAFQPAQRRA